MTSENKKKIYQAIILSTSLMLIPIIIGIILIFTVKDRKDLFEIVTALFSIIYLIIVVLRVSRNLRVKRDFDRQKEKDYEKQSSQESNYKLGQLVFLIPSIILAICSIVYFLVR